jgi:trigger factor
MEYSVKEKTQSKVVFEIKNNKEEIENTKLEAYQKLSKDVRIPGFRKGKAPFDVGAAFIGEANLLEETLNILIDKAYIEVLDKENISPIGGPDIQVGDFSKDGFTYTVDSEFLPQVDIDVDKKVEVPADVKPSEEEINAKLQELVNSFTQIVPEEKPIEKGDIVEVSYAMGDKKPKALTLEVGKEKVVGDFNEQIIGKKKGEVFNIHTESTTVEFTVVDVKRKIVPKIDDEFAKEAGFTSLDELNEKIKIEIGENKRLQEEEKRGKAALSALADTLQVELPQKYIEHDVDDRIKDIEKNYLKRGYKLEDILKQESRTSEDLRKEVKAQVEKELKEDLILREIISKKDIKATDEEIKEEFKHIVETEFQGKKIDLTDDLKRYIRQEILRSRAISILKESAIMIFGGD